MADEAIELVLEECREAMNKTIDGFGKELGRIRTGRANPSLLDGVHVDYYGASTALKSLATVSAPEARLLVIQPFDPSAIPEIERAILKADLGVTTANDGKLIRVPIPELNEERRRALVKTMKRLTEDHKVSVRAARRDAIAGLKSMKEDGDISEDDMHRGQSKVQDLTDAYVKKIDEASAAKEKEILTI